MFVMDVGVVVVVFVFVVVVVVFVFDLVLIVILVFVVVELFWVEVFDLFDGFDVFVDDLIEVCILFFFDEYVWLCDCVEV